MSYNRSEPLLHVNLCFSKQLLLLLSFLFAGAVVLVWLLDLPVWVLSLLTIVIALTYVYTIFEMHGWHRFAFKQRVFWQRFVRQNPVQQIRFAESTGWQLTLEDGQQHFAELNGSSFVSPFISVLNFHLGAGDVPQHSLFRSNKQSVVVMRDSFLGGDSVDQFRQLRVLLFSH